MEINSDYNYFLEHPVFGSKEVTYEEWVSAGGKLNEDFTLNGVTGVCKSKEETPYKPYKLYPDRRTLRDELMDRGIL